MPSSTSSPLPSSSRTTGDGISALRPNVSLSPRTRHATKTVPWHDREAKGKSPVRDVRSEACDVNETQNRGRRRKRVIRACKELIAGRKLLHLGRVPGDHHQMTAHTYTVVHLPIWSCHSISLINVSAIPYLHRLSDPLPSWMRQETRSVPQQCMGARSLSSVIHNPIGIFS